MQQNVEIEYRVRVGVDDFEALRTKFASKYAEDSHTKRLSFMSFFEHQSKQFDVRVRITNGDAEFVTKIGALHAANRVEISQPIEPTQLVGFARMMSNFSTDNYIAERETYNFTSPDKTLIISLVRSENVAYIEYELQDDSLNQDVAKKQLLDTVTAHGFTPLDESSFKSLNHDLDEEDWHFVDTPENVQRLEDLLHKKYS